METKLRAVSPEPGISLWNDLNADHYVLFVINLGLCCFLKGRIMKIPGTCCDICEYITNSLSLEIHQTKPGTVLWCELYSRKIFLDHWPVIMFKPSGNCHPFLNVLRLTPFKCL